MFIAFNHFVKLRVHSDTEAATPANLSSASASVSSLASSEDIADTNIAEAAEGNEPRAADTAAAERGPRVSASSALTTNGSAAASERGHL